MMRRRVWIPVLVLVALFAVIAVQFGEQLRLGWSTRVEPYWGWSVAGWKQHRWEDGTRLEQIREELWYVESGLPALALDWTRGRRTVWSLDGKIQFQIEFTAGGETRIGAPPWRWGHTDAAAPSAPWLDHPSADPREWYRSEHLDRPWSSPTDAPAWLENPGGGSG